MIKKLLMLALTSGLAAKALQLYLNRKPERLAQGLDRGRARARTRDDMQRWEDEGGNPPTRATDTR